MLVVLIALALGLFVGVLLVANLGGRALRRALRFGRCASRKLESVATLGEGSTRLLGLTALPAGAVALSTPLDGRPAVWFELVISSSGSELVREKKSIPSLLRDETGELELDLAGAELELGPARTWRGTLSAELPPGVDAGLRARIVAAAAEVELRAGIPRDTVLLELGERAVNVGQTLHVCGTVVRAGGQSSLLSSRPILAAGRSFGDLASRDALLALLCTTIALGAASALSAVVRAILEAKSRGA